MTDIRAIPMQENDANATTVGGYLSNLLAKVWREAECFNGKRPFGNSSWDGEIYLALVRAGVVPGVVDEDGYLEECDEARADALIFEAIDLMSTR